MPTAEADKTAKAADRENPSDADIMKQGRFTEPAELPLQPETAAEDASDDEQEHQVDGTLVSLFMETMATHPKMTKEMLKPLLDVVSHDDLGDTETFLISLADGWAPNTAAADFRGGILVTWQCYGSP